MFSGQFSVLRVDRWAECTAGEGDDQWVHSLRHGHSSQHGDEAPPPGPGEHPNPWSSSSDPQRAEQLWLCLWLQLISVHWTDWFFWNAYWKKDFYKKLHKRKNKHLFPVKTWLSNAPHHNGFAELNGLGLLGLWTIWCGWRSTSTNWSSGPNHSSPVAVISWHLFELLHSLHSPPALA